MDMVFGNLCISFIFIMSSNASFLRVEMSSDLVLTDGLNSIVF